MFDYGTGLLMYNNIQCLQFLFKYPVKDTILNGDK